LACTERADIYMDRCTRERIHVDALAISALAISALAI
jgi:hypothetical protein